MINIFVLFIVLYYMTAPQGSAVVLLIFLQRFDYMVHFGLFPVRCLITQAFL